MSWLYFFPSLSSKQRRKRQAGKHPARLSWGDCPEGEQPRLGPCQTCRYSNLATGFMLMTLQPTWKAKPGWPLSFSSLLPRCFSSACFFSPSSQTQSTLWLSRGSGPNRPASHSKEHLLFQHHVFWAQQHAGDELNTF